MNFKNLQELTDYKIYTTSNSSINTSTAYISDLEQFLSSMKTKYNLKEDFLFQIKPRDINLYLMTLKDIKSSTRARKRSSISSFFKFLYQNEYLKEDISSKNRKSFSP